MVWPEGQAVPHFEPELKGHVERDARARLKPGTRDGADMTGFAPARGLESRRSHAAEFSKTALLDWAAVKKPRARTRGAHSPRFRLVSGSLRAGSSVELQGPFDAASPRRPG